MTLLVLGHGCVDSGTGPTTPATEERARFMIVFRELRPDAPRAGRAGLMQVSVFAGRMVTRERARASEANTCYSLIANPCLFGVPKDAPVTLIAEDSPGWAEWQDPPVDTSDARPGPEDAVEFVGFAHPNLSPMPCLDSVANERGACVVRAQSDTTVVALYRRMRRVVIGLVGAGTLQLDVRAPPHLGLDPVPATNPLSGARDRAFLVAPAAAPVYALWLPSVSTVTLRATAPAGGSTRFKGWVGCAALGTTCELDLSRAATVTAEFEYWDCTAIGAGYASVQRDPRCVLR
jgi:hypothetical protein